MTIAYEDIYSRFFTIVEDPTFFKLDETTANDYMCNWIHDAIGEQYVRNAFSAVKLNDSTEQLEFTLTNSIDEDSDIDFVKRILSQFMKISWLAGKVDSILNVAVVIGGKEEKRLQSNYKTNIERVESLRTSLRKQIRDYGYFNNDYLES